MAGVLIKELSRDDDFKKVDRILREIRPLYEDKNENGKWEEINDSAIKK